jgi:hypothetical protein
MQIAISYKKPPDTHYIHTKLVSIPDTTSPEWNANPTPVRKKELDSFAHFNRIFVEPVALIDYHALSLRLGLEKYIARNWTFSATAGLYFLKTRQTINGWMAKAELKKYLWYTKWQAPRYISMEYLHKNLAYLTSDSILIPPNYKAKYTESKVIHALRLKYGSTVLSGRKIIFDYYVGAGVRFRDATTNLTKEEEANIFYNSESVDYKLTQSISTAYTLDICLGLKIGWVY